jgi:hypothetical protein
MTGALVIIASVVCGIPALLYLFLGVHFLLDRVCVRHAQRRCRRSGLSMTRVRWQPALEPSGVKTEFTLVQLDCLNQQMQRRLVLLLVWPFGVRRLVSDEEHPGSYDERWPLQCAS